MSDAMVHLGETLQDLADHRLSGTQLEQANAHLSICARCRRELAALRKVKQVLAPRTGDDTLPAGLSDTLSRMLDREDRAPPPTRHDDPSSNSWMTATAQDFNAYRCPGARLDCMTDDPTALERFFAAQDLGFDVRVPDLGAMEYRLEGGEARRLGDRPSALFVYRGAGDGRLLCERFRGRMDELPSPSHTADHDGVTFHICRQDTITAVLWAEREVISALVSDIDRDALIALAFAQAVPSA